MGNDIDAVVDDRQGRDARSDSIASLIEIADRAASMVPELSHLDALLRVAENARQLASSRLGATEFALKRAEQLRDLASRFTTWVDPTSAYLDWRAESFRRTLTAITRLVRLTPESSSSHVDVCSAATILVHALTSAPGAPPVPSRLLNPEGFRAVAT